MAWGRSEKITRLDDGAVQIHTAFMQDEAIQIAENIGMTTRAFRACVIAEGTKEQAEQLTRQWLAYLKQ